MWEAGLERLQHATFSFVEAEQLFEGMHNVTLQDCFKEPALRFACDESTKEGADEHEHGASWSDAAREEAYVHGLSCCVGGAIFDDFTAIPCAPASLVRDECKSLRRALLLGHSQALTDSQTRKLHRAPPPAPPASSPSHHAYA